MVYMRLHLRMVYMRLHLRSSCVGTHNYEAETDMGGLRGWITV